MCLPWIEHRRMPGLAVLLLAVLLSGCTTLWSSGETRTAAAATSALVADPAATRQHERALAALEAGDDAAARPELQSLVSRHPMHAGPIINLALLEARGGELDTATRLLRQALEVCTDCAVPWNALGIIERRQGRFVEAEQAYRNALKADPSHADASFNLGVLYELYLQRPELALAEYRQFRTLVRDEEKSREVARWISDLERRSHAAERSVRLEEAAL